MRSAIVSFSALALWACSEQHSAQRTLPDAEARTPFERTPEHAILPTTAPPDAAPPSTLEPIAAERVLPVPRAGAALPPIKATAAAARACTLLSDARLADGLQIALIAREQAPAALVVEPDQKHISLYTWQAAGLTRSFTHSLSEALATLSVTSPARGPSIAAWVDEKGGLHAAEVGDSRFEREQVVSRNVDTRFAPALSALAPEALAFTRSVDQTMHTFVSIRAAGAFGAPFDITPPGHGAAAPTFVSGAAARALYVIDARAGLSPLLEIALPGSTASAVVVRTPVSQPATPPLLRALRWSGSTVHVLYTAIGKLAASAVGHQVATKPEAPSALVPSFGYGELRFDALVRQHSAVAALEVPDDLPVSAPRHLELVVLDDRGEGPHFKLPTPAATRPSLASGRGDEAWLGYHAADGVHVARLLCGT